MEKNLRIYSSKQVVDWYRRLREIIPVEKKIFEQHDGLLRQENLLDIGIGGGRTTSYLLTRCKKYSGIDYSAKFVETVKKEWPGADCRVMDARDLTSLKEGCFGFVNFSFNGIDYVDAEGRKQILSGISRVLKPGGIFFFSTHNKDHVSFNKAPWLNRNNSLFTNLKTFLKLLPFLNRKRTGKKREQIFNDYAVITDSAHNYRLMTFYTTPGFLRKQLAAEGFEEINFYLRSGEKKEDHQLEDWIFVTAKKISV